VGGIPARKKIETKFIEPGGSGRETADQGGKWRRKGSGMV